MQIELKGEMRGMRTLKTKAGGELYVYAIEIKSDGMPETVNVFSLKKRAVEAGKACALNVRVDAGMNRGVARLNLWEVVNV